MSDAALRAVAGATGFQAVALGRIEDDRYTVERLHGQLSGLREGASVPVRDTLCWRMLQGAPPLTLDAGHDDHYRGAALLQSCEATTYVGAPVQADGHGVIGTLWGVDSRPVSPPPGTIEVMRCLAGLIGKAWLTRLPDDADTQSTDAGSGDVLLRRTSRGWQVQMGDSPPESSADGSAGEDGEDLVTAMSLADLMMEEFRPPPRPPRPDEPLDDVARLRLQVQQLEHALAARVVIEQAIGVLAERHGVAPRQAFERLRRVARSRGRKVHDVARAVVASAGAGRPSPGEQLGPGPLPRHRAP